MNDQSIDGSISAAKQLSESDYLLRQAEDAKAAAAKAFSEAKAALAGAVDPRELTRTHPFVAIGSVAVAGFLAALVAVPSKEQQELRRMEKIHRALHPEAVAPKDANGTSKPAPSLWSSILKEAIAVLKPIIITAITSGISSQANSPPSSGEPASDATSTAPNAGPVH